jgi:hypothetical protein
MAKDDDPPDDLFGWREGKRRKEASMADVEAHADEDWKAAALLAAKHTAEDLPYLTSDDVWALIPKTVKTHEPRALGPIMRDAAKAGWIEKAELPGRNSNRPTLHSSPRTVWKSLLFKALVYTLVDK